MKYPKPSTIRRRNFMSNLLSLVIITALMFILAIMLLKAFEKESINQHIATCKHLENRVEIGSLSYQEYLIYDCLSD